MFDVCCWLTSICHTKIDKIIKQSRTVIPRRRSNFTCHVSGGICTLTTMSRRCSRRRKDKRPRKELRKRRNMNKNRLKRPPLKGPAPPTPCPKTTSNMVWENIVLHYLNKLKNAWKSSKPEQNKQNDPLPDGAAPNDAGNWHGSTLGKCPPNSIRESKSFTSVGSMGSDCHHVAKQKALNIVKNAIEYGQSKGIISKNGKFFWLKSEMRENSSDIDPDYKHCTLSECKSILKNKKHADRAKFRSDCSSMSIPSILSKSESKRLRYRDYAKGKALHPKAFNKRKLRAHFEDDSEEECSCKRCKCKHKMYY